MGRRRERAHAVVPRRAAARRDQDAPHRAARLPARLRPREAGHAVLLHAELRPPEPIRPVRARRPRRPGAHPPRPQRPERRRHRGPGGDGAHAGRRAPRLQPLPQRQRPAGDLRPRRDATGKDLPDKVLAKFTAIIWTPDRAGFYYTRFPQPGSVPAGDENYFAKVYLHRLGESQDKDALIFESPAQKEVIWART